MSPDITSAFASFEQRRRAERDTLDNITQPWLAGLKNTKAEIDTIVAERIDPMTDGPLATAVLEEKIGGDPFHHSLTITAGGRSLVIEINRRAIRMTSVPPTGVKNMISGPVVRIGTAPTGGVHIFYRIDGSDMSVPLERVIVSTLEQSISQ